jgi:hypothetical protein
MAGFKDIIVMGFKAPLTIIVMGFKAPLTIPKAVFSGIGFVLGKIGSSFAYLGKHKVGTAVGLGTVAATVGFGTWAKENKLAKQEGEMNALQTKIKASELEIVDNATRMPTFENPDARSDNLANLQAREAAQKALAAAGTTR